MLGALSPSITTFAATNDTTTASNVNGTTTNDLENVNIDPSTTNVGFTDTEFSNLTSAISDSTSYDSETKSYSLDTTKLSEAGIDSGFVNKTKQAYDEINFAIASGQITVDAQGNLVSALPGVSYKSKKVAFTVHLSALQCNLIGAALTGVGGIAAIVAGIVEIATWGAATPIAVPIAGIVAGISAVGVGVFWAAGALGGIKMTVYTNGSVKMG